MASHQFAIAKASFSAGLLRPDPTSLSREDIARFNSLLNVAVAQCSPRNVQNCKHWILDNIIHSTARCTALGKYLTALATSFNESLIPPASAKREPSIKRRRLHILYILNDILHHAKYRINDASICSKIQPMLMSLFGNAASFKGSPKHHRKISDLLKLWEENGYYSTEYINKLRETVRNASQSGLANVGDNGSLGLGEEAIVVKVTKAAPYIMPAMHGDASTPWFDLPAGNLMPHIVPNSTRPINPEMIKPLQFVAGPADEVLALAVKTLLDDVQKIFGVEAEAEDGLLGDIDELGQPIILDDITGDVIEGEGYYGWSRSFCEKMKKRRNGPHTSDDRDRHSQSRSSSPDRRKRRYSDSDEDSSRSSRGRRQRRRSYSSSRSPSPRATSGNGYPRSRSRDRSRSNLGQPLPRTLQASSDPAAMLRTPLDGLPPKPPPSSYTNPPMLFPQGMTPNFPPPPSMAFNGSGSPWVLPPPPLNNMQFNTWPPPPPIPPNYLMPPGEWPVPGPGRENNNSNSNSNINWQPGRGGRGNYRGRD